MKPVTHRKPLSRVRYYLRMRFMTRMLLCLAFLPFPSSSACAQSDKDAEKVFEQSVLNQQLYLRNFSAETDLKARWTGNTVHFEPPFAHILLPLTIEAVKFKSSLVEIDALRPIVVVDPAKGLVPGPATTPVRILVDIKGANKQLLFPALSQALFWPSRDEALAAVPREHGGKAPIEPKLYPQLAGAHQVSPDKICDCNDLGTPACRGRAPYEGAVPMKILRVGEPEFSEEARKKKVNGQVTFSVVVDETGQITDIWIVQPLGLGLDENAVRALHQYVMQPATCHDRPVRVPMHLGVNFQTF